MSRLSTKQRRAARWRRFVAANLYGDGFGCALCLDAWAVEDAGFSVRDALRRGWTQTMHSDTFETPQLLRRADG